MDKKLLPDATPKIAKMRADLSPEMIEAWRNFSRATFKDGALPRKTKELIAVAVSHVTQCPYCIRVHTKGAKSAGASPEEIMEAIWVAAEMRAGAAVAHSAVALDELMAENG